MPAWTLRPEPNRFVNSRCDAGIRRADCHYSTSHGACVAVPAESIKGPASYFPSIEKKYGRPIGDWQQIVRSKLPAKHMELVAMLKAEHGLGHGHANAIVAHVLAEQKG